MSEEQEEGEIISDDKLKMSSSSIRGHHPERSQSKTRRRSRSRSVTSRKISRKCYHSERRYASDCTLWIRACCTRSRCFYIHDHDLKGIIPTDRDPSWPDCLYWLYGSCYFGSDCTRRHDPEYKGIINQVRKQKKLSRDNASPKDSIFTTSICKDLLAFPVPIPTMPPSASPSPAPIPMMSLATPILPFSQSNLSSLSIHPRKMSTTTLCKLFDLISDPEVAETLKKIVIKQSQDNSQEISKDLLCKLFNVMVSDREIVSILINSISE